MIELDAKGYPRLKEDRIGLAVFSPSNSDTGRGNDFHDPRTGQFTFSPPGNRVIEGGPLFKQMSKSSRKLLFDRAKAFQSNAVAARIVNGQLHLILLRDGKRVDSFALDPVDQREGEQQGPPQSDEVSGLPVEQLDDRERDILFQVARNVALNGEEAFQEVASRFEREISPAQKAIITQWIVDQRVSMLVAYLDLRFRQSIKGEKISDAEFKIKVGRGMLKKTVAGLDPSAIRAVSSRLEGLGWSSEDVGTHWLDSLPERLRNKPPLPQST